MKYIVLAIVALIPHAASAHTGHTEEGSLAQLISSDHIVENSIAFGLFLLIAIAYAYKKSKSLTE